MKTPLTRSSVHNGVYLFALGVLVCCLPLSRYILSLSQFLLALNWLAEGRFPEKISTLRKKPAVLIFISVILLYFAGVALSANLPNALVKIKNNLPLLTLPLIMSTSAPLSRKSLIRLMQWFILAVTAAAAICLFVYYTNPGATTRDFRKISLFMPHIRFALLIIMAIFILLYHSFYLIPKEMRLQKALQIIIALVLAAFLFVLRSFAGIIILFITGTAFAIRVSMDSGKKWIRNGLVLSVITVLVIVVSFIARMDIRNFHAPAVDPAALEKRTASGNLYEHNLTEKTLENGHYVNLFICEPELKQEWNLRSTIPYDSGDHKGQPVRMTLIRYLTSKGMHKDSAALSRLGNDEIRAIENGRANYMFRTRPGLYQRLYETLWEIHIWRSTGFVSYHSFGQRIVFYQSAGEVIRHHFFTGVGTGDVYDSMLETTRTNHKSIERRWKGEPHNQYAFLFMSFGVFGFAWILFAWIYPVYVSKAYRQLLFNLFAAIMLISMTVLDTIESYDNMVFFAFFYTLFVFCGGIQKKT
jgi:O-antigen ligase